MIKAKHLLISFLIAAALFYPGSPARPQGSPKATAVREYWLDPDTGLMWAANDNGYDVNWHQAKKFCRNLHLAGFSDWRLATIDELEGTYDTKAAQQAPDNKFHIVGLVKGGLSLTGNYYWSSSPVMDDRGHPSGYEWEFDYQHGKRHKEPRGYHSSQRVLCMRSSAN